MKDMKISLNAKIILSETSVGQIFHLIRDSLFDITQHNRHKTLLPFSFLRMPLTTYGSWYEHKKISVMLHVKWCYSCYCEQNKGLFSSSITCNPFFTWYGAKPVLKIYYCSMHTEEVNRNLWQRLEFSPCCFTTSPSTDHWVRWV